MSLGAGGVRTIRLRGATLTERRYPAGLRMPRHEHRLAYFTIVLGGGYDERIGSRERQVGASEILLHPQEEAHAVSFGAVGATILGLELERSTLGRLREAGVNAPLESWRRTAEADWLVARIYRESVRNDPCARLALEGLTLELLASGFVGSDDGGGRIERAEEYLRARLAEPIRLGDVAEAAGLHPTSLARAFRRERGTTVGEALRRLRVERASELILEGAMPLGQIAVEVGFSDGPHLARTFKEATGMSPTQYQKSRRGS